MPLCSVCSQKYDPRSILEKLADEILPADLELYDFGGGCTVAPSPDLGNNYLATHLGGIIEKNPPYRVILFSIRNGNWQKVRDNVWEFDKAIEEDLRRGLAAFPEKAAAGSALNASSIV